MVPAAGETLLAEVRSIGQELRREIEAISPEIGRSDAEFLYAAIAGALNSARDRLAALNLVGEANRLPSGELWKVAGDLLEVGWLQNRARTKPRGYAGDYEMLGRICEEWRCDHPLGSLFDRYFQSEAAPQAVRNRTRLMAEVIAQTVQSLPGPVRVVSVGSSAGVDVRQAAEQLSSSDRDRLQVTLLDLDPEALDYSQKQLQSLLPHENIFARRENLYRLPRMRQLNEQLVGTHLAYCTGLFDYLNEADGAALLKTMWNWLASAGRLLAFNFTLPNPTRTYMEWVGNWYLTYRTEEELRRLGIAAGIPEASHEIRAEATGVNLYLDARQQR